MNSNISLVEITESKLSPFASREADSKGRAYPLETSSPFRGEYQRDRDRVLHSKSFRRLMHKTQVFIAPSGEHYRTRLTHTLEVSGIARTIARALDLNEDLTEAISLGHDLGHTPFGHMGESALQQCFSKEFTHYRQSLRVVERLERDGKGLNLMWEVRDGIVNHQGSNLASTLEGRIVKFADRIAYINHDIDDAVRAGILSVNDIPKELAELLGSNHSARINKMVESVIIESKRLFDADSPDIAMDCEIKTATDALRDFLFEKVYYSKQVLSEEKMAKELIMRLFDYYCKHPDKMTELYKNLDDPIERRVCDFISGMTDRHAIYLYEQLIIPRGWRSI